MSWIDRYRRIFLREDEQGRPVFYPRAPRGEGYRLPAERVGAVRRYLTLEAWVHFGMVFGLAPAALLARSPWGFVIAAGILGAVGEGAYWLWGRTLVRDCPVVGRPGRNETIDLFYAVFPRLVPLGLLVFFLAMAWLMADSMTEPGPNPVGVILLVGSILGAGAAAWGLLRG